MTHAPTLSALTSPRLAGHRRGEQAGPLLLVIGGLHGNEPSGLTAARSVLGSLDRSSLRGDIVVLAGNVRALAQKRRFLDRDLNRGWSEESLVALRERARGAAATSEDLEQLELSSAIDAAIASARGEVRVVDLHATSAEGVPFVMTTNAEADRALGREIPMLNLIGILEAVDGTLAAFLSRRGHPAIAVEGGQNASPKAIANHEAVLWLALVATGQLVADDVPSLASHRARLEAARAGLPAAIEVVHRHALERGDGFRMRPGFANIQQVSKGELLAHDRHGGIRAEEDGWIVMPLYQRMGDDGFFIARALA